MQQAMLKGGNNIKGRAVPDGGMIAHPPNSSRCDLDDDEKLTTSARQYFIQFVPL